jgi:hypothetical protein
LLIRAYCDGQNAFKSDAAIVITIPDAARLGATGTGTTGSEKSFVLVTAAAARFALANTNGNAVKDTSVSATGL